MNKLICLVGISGSGKSHYSKVLAEFENAAIISSDAIRKEVTGSESDLTRDYYVWNKVIPDRLVKLLIRGNVIFDATGLTKSARRPILEYADEACADTIECHYFEPDFKRATKQNAIRTRVVPVEVIARQASKWTIPSKSEGFDKIVNIDELIRKYGTTDFKLILENERSKKSSEKAN